MCASIAGDPLPFPLFVLQKNPYCLNIRLDYLKIPLKKSVRFIKKLRGLEQPLYKIQIAMKYQNIKGYDKMLLKPDSSEMYHIFPKAHVTSNKDAYNYRQHFWAQFKCSFTS